MQIIAFSISASIATVSAAAVAAAATTPPSSILGVANLTRVAKTFVFCTIFLLVNFSY